MTIGPAIGSAHAGFIPSFEAIVSVRFHPSHLRTTDGKHNKLPFFAQTTPEVAHKQIRALLAAAHAYAEGGSEHGKIMIDTASAYQNSHTERVLGDIIASDPELRSKLSIHTKANAGQLPHQSLSKESVLYQAYSSLKNLRVDCIDIYYLHGPDINTPINGMYSSPPFLCLSLSLFFLSLSLSLSLPLSLPFSL